MRAARLMRCGHAGRIILSTAYQDLWEHEERLKKNLLQRLGVDLALVSVIPDVTNSYNEAEGVRRFVEEFGIDTLIVVADKWQEPRATEAFRLLFPSMVVFGSSFTTRRYEFTEEPSTIKCIRGGIAPLWVLWNLLFWFLTPMFVRRLSRSKRGGN